MGRGSGGEGVYRIQIRVDITAGNLCIINLENVTRLPEFDSISYRGTNCLGVIRKTF